MDNEQFRPTHLDIPISFFEPDIQRGYFSNVPTRQTTLRRIVKTKYYCEIVEAIRAETDEDKQVEMKKQLPAITPVAWLYHRRRNTTFTEKIRVQWPLLMGDIDKKDNPDVDMVKLKKHISRLPYVLLCAHSVRGGLWFVVRVPDEQTPNSLAAHFRYLQKLFRDYFEVPLDSTKGGNPTDLRFISYDPSPYFNESATLMTGTYTPLPSKPKPKIEVRNSENNGDLLQRVIQYAESAAEGHRHKTLLKAARLAGGFIAADRLDRESVIYALESVVESWPNVSKSKKTIQDGIENGMASPIYPDIPSPL